MKTDATGRYSAMYKPFHLIGLELNVSILSAALPGKPTGSTLSFEADGAATAKRDLTAGEMLDGEGGFTVWGKLFASRNFPRFESAAYWPCPWSETKKQHHRRQTHHLE
jgi:predicted homoserine dehydrogenase-like protein